MRCVTAWITISLRPRSQESKHLTHCNHPMLFKLRGARGCLSAAGSDKRLIQPTTGQTRTKTCRRVVLCRTDYRRVGGQRLGRPGRRPVGLMGSPPSGDARLDPQVREGLSWRCGVGGSGGGVEGATGGSHWDHAQSKLESVHISPYCRAVRPKGVLPSLRVNYAMQSVLVDSLKRTLNRG